MKRRGLLRLGTLITTFTGASAISALSASGAQAGPGDRNPSTAYVPTAEKGAASGVATVDVQSKIPTAELPDLLATILTQAAAPIAAAVAPKLDASTAATTYATKAELGSAGIQMVFHLGNAAYARPSTAAPVMWVGSVQPANTIEGDLYMVTADVQPLTTWHTAYSA